MLVDSGQRHPARHPLPVSVARMQYAISPSFHNDIDHKLPFASNNMGRLRLVD